MILVRFQGTCGNQLWQYAVARIYAEATGHSLYKDMTIAIRDDLVHFVNATNIDQGSGDNHGLINYANTPGGAIVDIKSDKLQQYLHGHYHHFKPLPADHDAYLLGFFQRFEYIAHHKEKIKSWFHVERDLPLALTDKDLVLSIRRGWNGYPLDQCPPSSFYEGIIDDANPERIILCTDTFEDPYFEFLSKYKNVHFANYDMMTQFCLIKSAKRIVLSPSTFCWWAAWLGDATTIYYPWFGDLIPAEDSRNWLVSEPRYVIVTPKGR